MTDCDLLTTSRIASGLTAADRKAQIGSDLRLRKAQQGADAQASFKRVTKTWRRDLSAPCADRLAGIKETIAEPCGIGEGRSGHEGARPGHDTCRRPRSDEGETREGTA